ncbi:hypothetical protein [Zunongwangia atlantica]|uniref:Uncharacterized protein n=1 Tax=Zunongwangia atlantica 22II14-10F7 TaxID=1185767 RepID=A0A1Y1SZ00_9FLAO|nr:hypothetical protein [Zunongwangia atlantica]ORL43575.1 hypothetical protein IIF7_20126 [Zunongwangia atlantica 22II14-10F7]
MLVAVLPLMSFSENKMEQVQSPLVLNVDCDAEALDAYNSVLPVYGAQAANDAYNQTHSDCLANGGDSEYEVIIDG